MTGTAHWHFLTPEYPPDAGGVSDYTALLANALSARGESVHVWVPSKGPAEIADGDVRVHRISGLGSEGLNQLDRGLGALPGPRRLFLQYVPTALGLRGMNVPLIRWLRGRSEQVWVQFHEVAMGWRLWRRPQHHLLHAVQLWMAAALAGRADKLFVSIEGWLPLLGAQARRAVWLPIPSNLPTSVSESERARARASLGPGSWITHFGTYGEGILRDLIPTTKLIAQRHPDVRFLLLGRGAERLSPLLPATRVSAPGELPAQDVAARLTAATIALQPFPDGISARRTSAMGPLALGVPVVSTRGHLTDSVWTSETVALSPAGRPDQLASACLDLLANPERRKGLGARGAALYSERFSLARTLETLLRETGGRVDGRQ